MESTQRYKRLQKLIKIQEQMVLVEFRELQRECDLIKNQINDLELYRQQTANQMTNQITSSMELTVIRSFAANLESALEVLHNNLSRSEGNYAVVGEKIKEIRSTLVSVNRLVERSKAYRSNTDQIAEQIQLEENLGYLNMQSE